MEAMALATEAMVDTVWDTPDSMVDMVWDTPLVPMDTALWDTEATTSARERLRLSQRLNPRLTLMPTMAGEAMALATEAMVDTVWDTPDSMVDTVWDTAPMDILVMLDMEATDTDVDTATMVEREVICYKRSRLTDY